MEPEETICAIATPVGEGGVGIVRISGDRAISIASQVVRPRNHVPLEQLSSHRLYLSDVLAENPLKPEDSASYPLDEALVVVMKRPRSYTGEDIVELQTHGGSLILQLTCDALIRQGARLAEPGEFTKRAFLNGRLDLTQAEAVLDTIRATTASSLRTAQGLLRGTLRKEVERLRDELIRNLAHLEAGLDFVDEDILCIQSAQLERVLHETQAELQRLIETFDEGRIIREGIKTAIIGRPNVGKSSLLNILLNMDRAIVSPVPGTTRDTIEESVAIAGMSLRLFDTAGLRHTEDFLEAEGIRRTRETLKEADLYLLLLDGSVGLTEEDRTLLHDHTNERCLIVVNKNDLPNHIDTEDILTIGCRDKNNVHPHDEESTRRESQIVRISAKTGMGMDNLKERIRTMFCQKQFETGQPPIVTHLRHKAALVRSQESILQAQHSLQSGMDGECLALDMRAALDALGEITGVVSTDDILDQIFRDFCIGK